MVRPRERTSGGQVVVLEVLTELFDELAGELVIGDLVDGADDLLGMPGHAHVTMGSPASSSGRYVTR
jgi:hypothetical protein